MAKFSGSMKSKDDINIRVGVTIGAAMRAFDQLEQRMQASSVRMSRLMDTALNAGKADDLASQRATAMWMQRRGADNVKEWERSFANLDNIMPRNLEARFKPIDEVLGNINKKVGDGQPKFAGYAMSIMFFGMAVQRIFLGLWKSATKTFQDVMHSVEGTVTGTDMLSSSFAYLKFSIGEALDPVMQWLVPIIDAITEWTIQNPRLTATIISLGAALGTLFMVGGAGKLAYDGFVGLGVKLGLLTQVSDEAGSSLAMAFSLSSPWIIALLAAAAAAAFLVVSLNKTPAASNSVKNSFSRLQGPVEALKQSFLDMLSSIFDMEIGWDEVAWTAAWAIDSWVSGLMASIDAIQIVFHAIAGIVDILQVVQQSAKAAWEALIPGGSDGTESLQEALDNMESAQRNFAAVVTEAQSWGSNMSDAWSTLTMGPQQFRQESTGGTTIYFGEVNVQPQAGETPADVINRILSERGVTQ